ncbi:MAG TPA: alkaline phosphatase family protein [Candidatus Bathyarchaeia archaeon]|nr:alkaline phosphatase family protein [Candidatus Bathyarchaeia archaeon]
MVKTWVLAILAIIVLSTLSQGARAAPGTATPIQHVIIIMQENHSFDNYFGTYPTANGTLLDSTTAILHKVNGIPDQVCLPYLGSCVSPKLTTGQDPANPNEGQLVYQMDYSNNGTGFPTYSGPQSMVYFDYHSIPAYWDYAEEYGLADNYFAPILSQTTPNRLMILAGDTSVSSNYGPPPYIPYSQTLMQQLDSAGVSWGYYDYTYSFDDASSVYPLNYVSDRPPQAINDTREVSDLFQELIRGSGLPSVTFVSSLGNAELDEHPSSNPTTGELWTVDVINTVMKSVYWPETAIFLTWDEGGGYYDHVTPPKEFSIDHNFSAPLEGLGQRVPLLVISSYSRENIVSNTLMSHLSLLHFIEYNWKLSALNSLISESNLPLEFFNFSQSPRQPTILNPFTTYPIPLESSSGGISPVPPLEYGILLVSTTVILLALLARTIGSNPSLPRKRSSEPGFPSNTTAEAFMA